MTDRHHHFAFSLTFLLVVATTTLMEPLFAADPPSTELALRRIRPVHRDVDIEHPTDAELAQCRVEVESTPKTSGWVVFGPHGQVLRRFVDTNGDGTVDQWSYYKHGLEVYRNLDANFNKKVDQARWLNSGGTKWGIMNREDSRIDEWRVISAEEASEEAIKAMSKRDVSALSALLISKTDIEKLSIQGDLARDLLDSVSNPSQKMTAALQKSAILGADTKWMRFDSNKPGLIPVSDGKASQDINVYENAMAIVETKGKPGLVQIGELVRVGTTWKLTQIPQPLDSTTTQITAGGILMQPPLSPLHNNATELTVSPEMQKLLEQLQKLDSDSPDRSASPAAVAQYHSRRADILTQLVNKAETAKERDQWTRQMVDGIAAAVQTNAYPDGIARLKTIESTIRRSQPNSSLVAYVVYRRMLSEYNLNLQKASNEERQTVTENWLKEMETFTRTYPKADDTPDAMLQLAMTQEFRGKQPEAVKWYTELARAHSATSSGIRATGALRRMNLEGKQLVLKGNNLRGGQLDVASLRGKTTLVIFWATWCKPCTEDLPQLKELYRLHRSQSFEIVGVNIDTDISRIAPYLKQHQITWSQIHEPGGLESKPARDYGIISLPTMFLIDTKGQVISRNTTVEELKEELPKILAGKS